MKFSETTILAIAASVATVLLSSSTNVVDATPACECDGTSFTIEPEKKCDLKCDSCDNCVGDLESNFQKFPGFYAQCGETNSALCIGYRAQGSGFVPPSLSSLGLDFPDIADAGFSPFSFNADPVGPYPDFDKYPLPECTLGDRCNCPATGELKMVCYKCGGELDCLIDDLVYPNSLPDTGFDPEAAGNSILSPALRQILVDQLTPQISLPGEESSGFCNDKFKTVKTEQPDCDKAIIGFTSEEGCCLKSPNPNAGKCPVFGLVPGAQGDGKGLSNIATYTLKFCDPGGHDDPHFDTFGGEHYDFQGACDLVLVDNPDYKNGKGLFVHSRTKLFGSWSSFVSGAVKIGDDVLEVHGEDLALINGIEFPVPEVAGTEYQFPVKIGGFDLTVQIFGPHSRRHIIHMGNGEQIRINNFKEFVNVFLHKPHSADFAGSTGMLGTYSEEGSMLGRDRKTVIKDGDAFGFEWQVRPGSDPQLFHVIEGPQYPAKCEMPENATAEQRHLRAMGKTVSEDDAKKACSKAIADQMDACIANVFGSDNLEMAQLYTFESS